MTDGGINAFWWFTLVTVKRNTYSEFATLEVPFWSLINTENSREEKFCWTKFYALFILTGVRV